MTSHNNQDFMALMHTKCERKIARKTKKKLKAACRLAHAQHKTIETVIREKFDGKSKEIKKREKRKRHRARKRMQKLEEQRKIDEKKDGEEGDSADDFNMTLEQFRKEARQQRLKLMKTTQSDEDYEIKRLEAKLRKSKKRRKTKEEANESEDEAELDKLIFDKDNDS